MLDERLKTCFENIPVGFGQIDKAEGLQPSLRGPHGKEHLHGFADGGFAQMKDQLDVQLFVERLLQVEQSTGGGNLMQLAAQFTTVGQANERQDGAAQLDAKGARSKVRLGLLLVL